MKDQDRLERFLDDLEVVWLHYRRQSYLPLGTGFVAGLLVGYLI